MNSKKYSTYIIFYSSITNFIFYIFFNFHLEILTGLIVPLIGSLFSSNIVYYVFKNSPKKLTSFMIQSFFLKMLVYGFLLILLFNFSSFNQHVFFISFIGYFISFHLMEALFIKHIFNKG